jgi:hypothetical protein
VLDIETVSINSIDSIDEYASDKESEKNLGKRKVSTNEIESPISVYGRDGKRLKRMSNVDKNKPIHGTQRHSDHDIGNEILDELPGIPLLSYYKIQNPQTILAVCFIQSSAFSNT